MNYKPMTEAELRQGDDGRLISLAKLINGRYVCAVNIYPYRYRDIDKSAFEEFKQFFDLTDNIGEKVEGIVELYAPKHFSQL